MTIYERHEVSVAVAVAELYFRFMIDLALRSGESQASVARMTNVQSPQHGP